MFKRILLLGGFMSTTVFALPAEKAVDNKEYQISSANRVATVSGTLDSSSPTFDRRFGNGVSADCNHASSDSSQNGVAYQVFEFHSPSGQMADIEVELPSGSTLTDTLLFVYCSFDPANPADNLRGIDDDGGTSLASAIRPADGMQLVANTSYYAVVSGFSPTQLGDFNLILGGDLVLGAAAAQAPMAVPAFDNYGLLMLLVATVLLGFFYWRKN